MAGETGQTTSRLLNRMAYDAANNAADITTAATGDRFLIADVSDDYEIKWADGANLLEAIGSTVTAAELNKLDDSVTVLTAGAGVSSAETNASGYLRNGGVFHTQILVDLTGLVASATDLDIIGNTGGAASAHFGQITTALNGTMAGGKVTCLEVPAGGPDDVDFYSATVSTGAQDVDVTTLTETVLITSGGAWTSGQSKGMTGLPPANDYIYIVNGEAAAGGTYTAGKFLIEFFGK